MSAEGALFIDGSPPLRIEIDRRVAFVIILCSLLVEIPHLLLEFLILPYLRHSRRNLRTQSALLRSARAPSRTRIHASSSPGPFHHLWKNRAIFFKAWMAFVFVASIAHGFGISSSRSFTGARRPFGTHTLFIQYGAPPVDALPGATPRYDVVARCVDRLTVDGQEVVDVVQQAVVLGDQKEPSLCSGRNGSQQVKLFRYLPAYLSARPDGPKCPSTRPASPAAAADALRKFEALDGARVVEARCDDAAQADRHHGLPANAAEAAATNGSAMVCRAIGDTDRLPGAPEDFVAEWWLLRCRYGGEGKLLEGLYAGSALGFRGSPADLGDPVAFSGAEGLETSMFRDVLTWTVQSIDTRDEVERSFLAAWALALCVAPVAVAVLMGVAVVVVGLKRKEVGRELKVGNPSGGDTSRSVDVRGGDGGGGGGGGGEDGSSDTAAKNGDAGGVQGDARVDDLCTAKSAGRATSLEVAGRSKSVL